MWQFFHPPSLRVIQSLMESVYYDLVNSLDLSVSLGISWGRIFIRNSQLKAISPEGLTIKLKAIIRDEGVRDPEPGDNVFPEKLLGIHISDVH